MKKTFIQHESQNSLLLQELCQMHILYKRSFGTWILFNLGKNEWTTLKISIVSKFDKNQRIRTKNMHLSQP